MNLILLGAPGAGKSTQADVICARFEIPHIATGAMLRDAVKAGTALGQKVAAYVNEGRLVPDEIVCELLLQRITEPDCANGILLDGFPRTVPQAELLESHHVEIDGVISIEVEDSEIVRRMALRRVCGACGVSYHLEHRKPALESVCDACGARLIQREDDKPATVLKRLSVYHENAEPLKAYYQARGKLVIVQGQIEVDDTTRLTNKALEAFI